MTYYENKLITLNSASGIQQNGTALSNMLFNTGSVLVKDDNIISSNICIMNAQIPVSFYTITALNNSFSIQYLASLVSITIPIGNYNSSSLITTLQPLMAMTIVFNPRTGGFTFTSAVNFSLLFNVPNSAYSVLGFIKATYPATALVLASPYPINLLGVKRISIKSQSLGITSFSSSGRDITLTTIPCDQPSYNMISYVNTSDLNKAELTTDNINCIDIQMYDENGNFLDFNNIQWTICLCLENLRKMNTETITFNEILNRSKDSNAVKPLKIEPQDQELNILTEE